MSQQEETGPGKPPVFSSWQGWYALLIGVLTALVALFYWLTRAFA